MRRFHNAGGHVPVLDALVGKNGRREIAAQVHAFQTLRVQLCDGVAALPQGLQLLGGHALEDGLQPLRLG